MNEQTPTAPEAAMAVLTEADGVLSPDDYGQLSATFSARWES